MSTQLETDPTPNVELLREVADWVRSQVALSDDLWRRQELAQQDPANTPDFLWNQGTWANALFGTECKTVCCIAGYTALTSEEVDPQRSREWGVVLFKDTTRPAESWESYAQRKLGLTDYQVARLFYVSSGFPDDVLAILSEIAGEPV